MIKIYTSKRFPNILIYQYSNKICVDDVIQCSLFFGTYRKNISGKFDIICDLKNVNGYLDKDFLLNAAKQSRETEQYVHSVSIFGLKKIFHYMYKIYLSITSSHSIKMILFSTQSEVEKYHSIFIEEEFTIKLHYEKETYQND